MGVGEPWPANKGSRELPEHWDGPARHTLDVRRVVAKAFPPFRQLESVSFGHHAELTALGEADQDALLDWCETQEMQFKAGKTTVYPSVLALRGERKRREAAKLPPPAPPKAEPSKPPKVEPPASVPAAVALEVEPPEPASPPATALSDEAEDPSLPGDLFIPVKVFVPEEVHALALEAAAAADDYDDGTGVSLSTWILRLIAAELGRLGRL